jgi:DNA polymerase-3 subunit gamma/tau
MSLYRKYRPQSFSEIVDQEHIVKPLLSQLESGKITHAYLLSGPRGTGKTSIARIFAKAINCEKYKNDRFGEPCNKCDSCLSITEGRNFDVIELDAASNRGIDEIRDLREKVNLAPGSGRYKVYIIDEAHQLTNEAFNALLKTLEEPPSHAIFILATTEEHKIPATISSRVQKHQFHLSEKTHEKFKKITEAKELPQESLEILAKASGGSFRDGEVLLEKVIAHNPKAKPEEIEKILGRTSLKGISPFDLILAKNTKAAVLWLQGYDSDYKILGENLVETLRDLLMIKVGALADGSNKYPPDQFQALKNFSDQIPSVKLQKWITLFSEATAAINDSPIPILPLELAVIEACEFGEAEVREQGLVKEEKVQPKQETVKIVERETEVTISEPPKEGKPVKVLSKDVAKIEEVRKSWSSILQKVRSQNNSLGVFLRNAQPSEVDEGLLTLEVNYQFHKDLVEEPKNSELIAQTIQEALGKPVRIKGKVSARVEKPVEVNSPDTETDPSEIFGKLN